MSPEKSKDKEDFEGMTGDMSDKHENSVEKKDQSTDIVNIEDLDSDDVPIGQRLAPGITKRLKNKKGQFVESFSTPSKSLRKRASVGPIKRWSKVITHVSKKKSIKRKEVPSESSDSDHDVEHNGTINLSVVVVYPDLEKFDKRNTYQYKLRDSKFDELRKLGDFLIDDHKMAFKKAYGNLVGVLSTKEDTRLILTFAQFYDPTLHYFTSQDFLMAPTLEEFAHLLHLPVKDKLPYMNDDSFPDSAVIAQALHLKIDLIDSSFWVKGNAKGFPSKFLFEKATLFANSGSWDTFYASFSLLIYGLVLFPGVEGFIDKVTITIFISKIPVPTLLVYVFLSFHWRNMKKGWNINYCIPIPHKWILTHIQKRGSFADNVGVLKWPHRLMSLNTGDVIWYSHDYSRVEPIFHCGDFQNDHLISTKGG
ncbi:uncharacterized protein LOC127080963 [Lathyrus oleraceus]|uniref:uncharacterized protein LOC127080963 n=1 Tax=Pisum sativum TaxID=3888 RepID=UPI0021D1D387|nr:uncharacterized protein LOC127080963 [Pisum sativum]